MLTTNEARWTGWVSRGLWLTAGIMLGLIFFRADPISGAPPLFQRPDTASGGSIGTAGGYTIMTSTATNEDLYLVLDGRQEMLMIYRVENNNAAQLYQKLPLPQLFMEGRVRGGLGAR